MRPQQQSHHGKFTINQENVPAEIVQLMTSETAIINSDDTDLIRNICPDMVDEDNQPLPENVPTEGETTTTANQPQIFSSWELFPLR